MTKIGVGQAEFRVGEPDTNRAAIHSLLEEAAHKDVEILVIPELANSGYALADRAEALACSETPPDGPTCRLLADWSRLAGRLVVCGLCERAGERLYNAAVVFAGGTHLATYRKAHLFMKESQIFTPGPDEPPVVEFNGWRLGILVCYDWAFPEMTRLLALRRAQALLHPSNLVLPYGQRAMVVRGIENHVFTATANRFGTERGIPFSGCSQITTPKGEVIAQASGDFSGVLAAEVDLALADDKMITPYNHVFNDRRVDLYGGILDE